MMDFRGSEGNSHPSAPFFFAAPAKKKLKICLAKVWFGALFQTFSLRILLLTSDQLSSAISTDFKQSNTSPLRIRSLDSLGVHVGSPIVASFQSLLLLVAVGV